ncbi:MAG: hypothetical protein LBG65_08475 [Puniceicoccales bacterium]|jgi:hypothetical protein|nr:hypothetical protein [Puniceicoccales bacterium]
MKQDIQNTRPVRVLAALAFACSFSAGCANIENPDEDAPRAPSSAVAAPAAAATPAATPAAKPAPAPGAEPASGGAAAPRASSTPAPSAAPSARPAVSPSPPPPAPPAAPDASAAVANGGLEARPVPATAKEAVVRPGLELRLAHCAYFPAAGATVHKLVGLPENPANPASPVSEYEVLAGLDGLLFYAKPAAEFDEKDVAAVEPGTTGLASYVIYRLTEDGARKLREATEKVAAMNNVRGNGHGRLLFVLDGRVVLAFSLGRASENDKYQGFPATNTPNTISIDAESYAAADAQVAAFTRRNNR